EEVTRLAVQSVKAAAALVLLRDEHGAFRSSQQGEATLVTRLLTMLQRSFDELVATGGTELLTLTNAAGPLEAIAAVIPGVGRSMGVVCLAREIATGGFLPDE